MSNEKCHLKEYVKEAHNDRDDPPSQPRGCLNKRCCDKYTPDHVCSYRWNGHEVAKTREDEAGRCGIYNLSQKQFLDIADDKIKSGAYETNKSEAIRKETGTKQKLFVKGYGQYQELPRYIEDWDLDGPKTQGLMAMNGTKIPVGKNFTESVFPYWHNTHHLIPYGIFNELIDEDSEVEAVMRAALYFGKYNFNYGINTIILPQG